jgi:hypothetical protein
MGFFKNLVMKQALKRQMKGVPEDMQNKLLSAMEKDPAFFERIAKDIKQKVKEGKTENEASMEVMRMNQDALRKLMM